MLLSKSVTLSVSMPLALLLSVSACTDDGLESEASPSVPAAASDAGAQPADASSASSAPPASSTPNRRDSGASPNLPTAKLDAGALLDAGPAPSDVSDAASSTNADASAPVASDGGHFPRLSEAVNTAKKGPYTFKKYTEGLNDPKYASAVMYYPVEAAAPFAAIVFSPGFTATKEDYTVLGEIFASHGFAMMLTTPTSINDYPPARGDDLVAAFNKIRTENERAGSPLQGKLAVDRVCITGHSMGGGGTLWGATSLGDKIRCAVPLQPWEPGTTFAKIVAPTLFIAAQRDNIAGVAQNASVHYASIPDTVEKIYAEFKGADHFLTTNGGTMFEEQSSVMVSFYKLKLEDDERYRPFLYGEMAPKVLSKLTFSKK